MSHVPSPDAKGENNQVSEESEVAEVSIFLEKDGTNLHQISAASKNTAELKTNVIVLSDVV